jgi:hypothetical protein
MPTRLIRTIPLFDDKRHGLPSRLLPAVIDFLRMLSEVVQEVQKMRRAAHERYPFIE